MNELKKNINLTTAWIKIQINEGIRNHCFIGNYEAIAFNLNSYILFKNLNTGYESFYRADGITNGDGVAEVTGHKVYPIFAFAESNWGSRIFIVSYPDFGVISIFEPKEECVYIGLAFSETEHLIALTGMPSYKLQVFYWRTHDLLISKETEMITDKQKITCSYTLPLTVAQFAYSRGELIIWEVHGTLKYCKLIQRKIELNFHKINGPFQDVYTVEGNVLIIDKYGDIYNVVPSTGVVSQIVKNTVEKRECDTCITYIRNGALVACSDGNLKYFKRQKLSWNEIFQVSTKNHFISLKSHDNETAIGIASDGSLYKLYLANDAERLLLNKIHLYDPAYTNFVLIYPYGNHLVAVNLLNEIYTIFIETGEKISQLLANIRMNQVVIKANPIFPFVAIGNNSGNVYCVSLFDPNNPTLLTEFLLSRQPIQAMQFSNNGNFLIVNDVEFNQFMISTTPGTKMSVLYHFKEDFLATEFFAIENRNELSLILLTKSIIGINDKIFKFCIHLDDPECSIERFEWELVTLYNTIIPFLDTPDTFYAIRKNSSIVEILKLDNESISLVSLINTPHLMKNIEGWNDRHHLITWSIDGTIAIYNIQKRHSIMAHFVAANRHHFGIKKARCDPKCEFVVVLDHTGNLICSVIQVEATNDEKQFIQEKLKAYETFVGESFSKTTSGGFPTLDSQDYLGTKKFTDLKDERAYQMEAEESEDVRNMLFEKIEILRKHVQQLLNENENNEEHEKLEIQEFNLDLDATNKKEDEARQERDQQDKKMMDFIDAQSALNQWIIDKCWNHLSVKGTKLRGMFFSLFVENFPLLPYENDNKLEKIHLIRSIEHSVAREDSFVPWRPIPTSELEKIFIKEPSMFELDAKDFSQFNKLTISLMGSSSYRFLEVSPLHYQQLDVVTFHQMKIEKILVESELLKLKTEFNKKFDAMHRTKEYQIHSIRFKNDRLRHIQSELKILDELKGLMVGSLVQILDPDFLSDEIPDTVIHVIESEVPVPPYVSPSMQKVLQEQEAAREQRRKELEADDFRDRALDVMMDGVLEYKWEDEIKKNPKAPECILKEKPGEDWTEIEERQVLEYEQEFERLKMEREKYRRMLLEEQKMLQSMLDEEIYKFNFNLCELSVEKLKFDMAIGHEEMKLLMLTSYNFKRIIWKEEEIRIRQKMEQVKKVIEKLNNLQSELQEWTRELKLNYENLQVKDKTMEKQFKANFNEQCPQAPADQAFKYFKRRPKLQMRAQITAPILLEIAKRVGSKKMVQHAKLLPSECTEFLNGVDSLDQVSTSTTGIDSASWQVLCKMRRIKIESEFKIKSLCLQVADAESSHLAFVKETNMKRQYLQSLERQLVELKETRENDLINRYVQLVMKKGLIEVYLSGNFSDFNDSILIHRSDVADINQIILKAGRKKLMALSNGSFFRRRITLKEWEHKVLKLKVKDLEEFVKTIEKCKITKEVQQWLKRKERGWSDDLTEDALKRQIENSINSQEKILSDLLKEISAYQNHIDLKRKEMKIYDKEIQLLNIDVSEKNVMRDIEFEREQVKAAKEKMSIILERAKIVRTIQNQHSHLLQLTTLLELQRLKTFPTLTAKQNERYQKTYC